MNGLPFDRLACSALALPWPPRVNGLRGLAPDALACMPPAAQRSWWFVMPKRRTMAARIRRSRREPGGARAGAGRRVARRPADGGVRNGLSAHADDRRAYRAGARTGRHDLRRQAAAGGVRGPAASRLPNGTVLVVGHSNTAPDIAAALCGCVVAPMGDDEYDRRLTIRFNGDGKAALREDRY